MIHEMLHIDPVAEVHYSIGDITDLYGLDEWTVRMWVDRFEIPGHISTADGGILFTLKAVECIGAIRRSMKNKMKVKEIRKYLESDINRSSVNLQVRSRARVRLQKT